MSADYDGYVTLGDIDVDVDIDEDDDSYPFEVDTRGEGVVIAHDTAARLIIESLSPEAAFLLADELEYAADHASYYKRENENENETGVSE